MEKEVIQPANKYSTSQAEKLKEIGAYLQQKRIEQSLSLEEIASSTFIRLPMLQALENGQFEQLPPLIYVQGFIRRYSEILRVDGQALAKSLSSNGDENLPQNISPEIFSLRQKISPTPPKEASSTQEIEHPPQFITDSQPKVTSEPQDGFSLSIFSPLAGLSPYLIYLLLLLAAIGGLFYVLSHSSNPEVEVNLKPSSKPKPVVKASSVSPSPLVKVSPPATTKPTISPSPLVKVSPSATTKPTISPSPLVKVSPSATTKPTISPSPLVKVSPSATTKPTVSPSPLVTVSPSATTKPTVSPSPLVTVSPSPKPNSPVSVTVNLEDSSWLRIQADGKTIYEGILTKGNQKTWTAEKELTVRAGNAGAVKFSLNKAPSQLLGKPGEVKELTFK